jgi:hypothetical protein
MADLSRTFGSRSPATSSATASSGALADDADRDLLEILRELDAGPARQEAYLRQRRASLLS